MIGMPVESISIKLRRCIVAIDGADRFGLVLHSGERFTFTLMAFTVSRFVDGSFGKVDRASYSLQGAARTCPRSHIDNRRVGDKPFKVDFTESGGIIHMVGKIANHRTYVGLVASRVGHPQPGRVCAVVCKLIRNNLRSPARAGRVVRVYFERHNAGAWLRARIHAEGPGEVGLVATR